MTLETFFEKFDQFADAPDAVEKIRALVLELAATGRLVPRKGEWETRSLKSLATKIGSGATPAGGRESYFSKGIPLIRSMNVHFRGFDRTGLVFLSDEQADELSNVVVQSNDVLLNITGASIGRVTIAPTEISGARVNQHVTIIRPTPELFPRFLSMFLASPSVQRIIDEIQVGATRQALTKGMIEQFEIPLPPVAEQKRIVAKVDGLMALCDRLEAQQQERRTRQAALARASLARFADAPTPANLPFLFHPSYSIPPADLRKSILTLAVQGKLVPQDPDDEPAGKVLTGVAGDVAKAIRAKRMRNPRPIPAYEDELPFDLPVGWAWAPLGTLTAAEDGAMCDGPFGSKLKTEHYIPTKGYAVLRLGNIGVGYFIHGKEGHISREHFESLPSNHTAPGDLLVAGLADPLVRCCEVPPDIGPAANKSDCFRVRLSNRLDRSYVRHYLNSPIAKAFAAEDNHGMTRERINLANAKALPVSVPPLAEQRRIVAKVDQLMALVDALETQLTASRATAANLLSALVAELTAPKTLEKSEGKMIHLHSTTEFVRSQLAAEVVDRMHEHESLGQTKFQKIIYLAEYLFELPEIDSRPRRFARGPHDPDLIEHVEGKMKQCEWFESVPRASGVGKKYVRLALAGAHRSFFEKQWPHKAEAIRSLIDQMKTWSTERCERFATVYAAWNDLILWNKAVTDKAILHEVLENWHPEKLNISKPKWIETLSWMRSAGHIPRGFGRPTAPAPHPQLFRDKSKS